MRPLCPPTHRRFQSTLPVWGATTAMSTSLCCTGHFNPRSPCGERRSATMPRIARTPFQSTLPVWGATVVVAAVAAGGVISIHAPRVGSDAENYDDAVEMIKFQSTLPVWGATAELDRLRVRKSISIHAPRVGSDIDPGCSAGVQLYFNPRSPCGERR